MFLLLRDARAAGLLHDRRPGFFAGQGIADLWSLHRLRLSHPDLWRNDRRSLAGAPPRGADRRRDDGAWSSGSVVPGSVLYGARLRRAGQWDVLPKPSKPAQLPLCRRRYAATRLLLRILLAGERWGGSETGEG